MHATHVEQFYIRHIIARQPIKCNIDIWFALCVCEKEIVCVCVCVEDQCRLHNSDEDALVRRSSGLYGSESVDNCRSKSVCIIHLDFVLAASNISFVFIQFGGSALC